MAFLFKAMQTQFLCQTESPVCLESSQHLILLVKNFTECALVGNPFPAYDSISVLKLVCRVP